MTLESSRLCPVCHQPTIPSSVGDICVHCDKVWPYHFESPKPQTTSPAKTEAHHAQSTTIEHFHKPTVVGGNQTQHHESHNALNPMASLEPDPIKPSHASAEEPHSPGHTPPSPPPTEGIGQSYDSDLLKPRLHKRIIRHVKRLVVPELPSVLDPEHELEPPDQKALANHTNTSLPSADHPANQATQTSTAPPPTDLAVATKAAALAEEIAEQDSVPPEATKAPVSNLSSNDNLSPDEPEVTEVQQSSHLVLIATISVLLLVLVAGLWLNSAQKKTSSTTKQEATSTPRKPVSADVAKRDAQRKQDLIAISTALEVYRRQQGSYPAGNDINAVYALQYTTPPYISYINYDPSSSDTTKIKYSYTSDGNSFTLAAKLENPNDDEAQAGYYIVRSK